MTLQFGYGSDQSNHCLISLGHTDCESSGFISYFDVSPPF